MLDAAKALGIEIPTLCFLPGRAKLEGYPLHTLIQVGGEGE